MLRWFIERRMTPKRIWQAALVSILLMGFYALLPPSETTIARQWLEAMLGRFR